MHIRDIATRARKSLAHAKARTVLTSLAIGVGAFTITLSLAAGVGGKQYAERIVTSNIDPSSLIVSPKQEQQEGPSEYAPDKPTSSMAGPAQYMTLLNDKDIKKMQATAHVRSVQPSIEPAPLYITRDGQKKYDLSSLVAFDPALSQAYEAGNPHGALQDTQVVINKKYRKALGFSSADEAVGKTVRLAFRQAKDVTGQQAPKEFSFTIAAVTGKSNVVSASSGEVLASFSAIKTIHEYVYQGTNQGDQYMYASVKADETSNVDSVKQALDKAGYDAQTAEDIMQFIFQFINVLQGILLGFGALAVLTAIFGIINTQYISVLERTQQIGLMKALGMRRRDVGRLFKFEAAWIGFLGGAIGAGLAYVGGVIANPYISDFLQLDKGVYLLVYPWWVFVAVIGGLMAISVGAGILPARKAAKLDPIEALRTE